MEITPIISPVGELIWSSLSRPRKTDLQESYEITLILKKADAGKLHKLCREAYCHQLGVSEVPANFQVSIRRDEDSVESEDPLFMVTFRRKRFTKRGHEAEPVPCFDAFGNESMGEVPNGSTGRVKFLPFSYEFAGKKGVSLYLVSVQVLKRGENTQGTDVGFEVDEIALQAQKEAEQAAEQPNELDPEFDDIPF
jgi:hypothetical protein